MKKLVIAIIVFVLIISTTSCRNTYRQEKIDIEEEYDGIGSVRIEYNVGTLRIKSGDTFRIEGKDVCAKTFESKVEDGVWYISNKPETSSRFFRNFRIAFGPDRKSESAITIYVPQDVSLDEFTIILGVGKIEADELRVENFDVKIGTGDIRISNLFAEYLNIKSGVGSIKIDGEISKDSTVKTGVGSVELTFSGAYDEYNYEVAVGIGSASINENVYSVTTRTSINNPNSKGTFSIDVGIGELSLKVA